MFQRCIEGKGVDGIRSRSRGERSGSMNSFIPKSMGRQ